MTTLHEKAGAVLLTIPAEMRVPHRNYRTTLRVGPFENKEEAFRWEKELARGMIEDTPTRGYVEARTVYGRAIKELLGRGRVEINIAPRGKDPTEPERHFIVEEAKIAAYSSMRPSSLISPDHTSGKEVGNNIGLYISRRIAETV